MSKCITYLLIVLGLHANAQIHLDNIHYRNRIDNASLYFNDQTINHSSILPVITTKTYNKGMGYFSISNDQKNNGIKVYPLTHITIGLEGDNKYNGGLVYDAGVGAGIDLNFSTFFITAKFLPYATQSTFVRDSIQDAVNMDPGASRALFKNGFQKNEFVFAYRPNRFFTFLGGQGRNFFGEGYRSLILSDNSASTPFFKIETAFSSIKYVNLYQMWKDNAKTPSDRTLDKRKFAAMHYISWNISREFNLSIFESVVWQSNDTLINRGFDPNYLNPVVFYRPVEYGSGSADNVLLGANMSFKFNDKHSVYSQIILDDFLLREIKARSRWWANKYGVQIGYKSSEFLNTENLYFQAEFNTVRPFTYSHKHSGQAYGNLNASVTHPIGANLFEILGIVSYKTEKLRLTNKLTYSGYGTDTSATSYGQNIFISYDNRDGKYDHFIMQGYKKNVINETIIIETPLVEAIDLYLNLTYNWRMEQNANGVHNSHYLGLGIRSRIWNTYTDF